MDLKENLQKLSSTMIVNYLLSIVIDKTLSSAGGQASTRDNSEHIITKVIKHNPTKEDI